MSEPTPDDARRQAALELAEFAATAERLAYALAALRKRVEHDPDGRRALVDGIHPAALVTHRTAVYLRRLAIAAEYGTPFADDQREFAADLAAVVAHERRRLSAVEHAAAIGADLARFAAGLTGADSALPDEVVVPDGAGA